MREHLPISSRRASTRRAPVGLAVAVAAAEAAPMLVGLAAVWSPRWHPLMDMALIEMHVRDVGTGDRPLTGPYGRFPVDGDQAAHPGPLGFYALWPGYRLFGSSSRALQVSSVLVHGGALLALLWVVRRRGSIGVLLGVGLVAARTQPRHRAPPAPPRPLAPLTAEPFGRRGGSTLAIPSGSVVPGALLLLGWVLAVATTWRDRVLRSLHLVVGAAVLGSLVAMSRIVGENQLYWVSYWGWGTCALVVLATTWGAALAIGPLAARLAPATPRRTAARASLLAGLAVVAAAGGWSARTTELETRASRELGRLVPPTAAALEDGIGAATGRGGRYQVVWTDPVNFGAQGMGLVNELDRRGFDVGVLPTWAPQVGDERIVTQPTAIVRLVGGAAIADARHRPGAVEVATVDLRTREERATYRRLEAEVAWTLGALDQSDLIPALAGNLWGLRSAPSLPQGVRDAIGRMVELGPPYAVYIAPPDPA